MKNNRYIALFIALIMMLFCLSAAAENVIPLAPLTSPALEEAPQDKSAFLDIDLDGDGAVTEADFTGMLRLSVGLDAFGLPDRSMPAAQDAENDTSADTGSTGKSAGGSSYSDSDYWDKPWGPVPGALPKERLDVRIEGAGDAPRTVTILPHGSVYEKLVESL